MARDVPYHDYCSQLVISGIIKHGSKANRLTRVGLIRSYSHRYERIAYILLTGYLIYQTGIMGYLKPYEIRYFNQLMGGTRGAEDRLETD